MIYKYVDIVKGGIYTVMCRVKCVVNANPYKSRERIITKKRREFQKSADRDISKRQETR